MGTSYTTERIDDEYMAALTPSGTHYSKAFIWHGWSQKLLLILADQQVTVSIMYTMNTEYPLPNNAEFYVLTTAKNVVLAANEIIPFGVEDPVHFVKVKIDTGLNPTNVRILALGSR